MGVIKYHEFFKFEIAFEMCGFYMRRRISIRGRVRPLVRWSIRQSVRRSVRPSYGPSIGPSVRPSVHPTHVIFEGEKYAY